MSRFIKLTYEIHNGLQTIHKPFAVNIRKIESFEDGIVRTASGNQIGVVETADEIWKKIDQAESA